MYLQPGHEELLELLVYKEGSSTVHSTEVNVFQEEDSADDPQSNDQAVPITLEHNESKVLDLECLLEDPEGNDCTKG